MRVHGFPALPRSQVEGKGKSHEGSVTTGKLFFLKGSKDEI